MLSSWLRIKERKNERRGKTSEAFTVKKQKTKTKHCCSPLSSRWSCCSENFKSTQLLANPHSFKLIKLYTFFYFKLNRCFFQQNEMLPKTTGVCQLVAMADRYVLRLLLSLEDVGQHGARGGQLTHLTQELRLGILPHQTGCNGHRALCIWHSSVFHLDFTLFDHRT